MDLPGKDCEQTPIAAGEKLHRCDPLRAETGENGDGLPLAIEGGMEWPSADRLESITDRIIASAIAVHTTLGPGLLESIYRDCLAIELRTQKVPFVREHRVRLTYRGEDLADDLKVDLLVEGAVIIEVKAVERLHPVHQAQVITYLKLSGCPAGLLLNFNATSLRAGLKRLDHPNLYAIRRAARNEVFLGDDDTRTS